MPPPANIRSSRLVLLTLVLVGMLVGVAAGDRVFDVRYRGGGVSFREADPRDRLYPVNVNNWWGHMNQNGELVVFPRFDWTDYSYGDDGLARAVVDERTGYVSVNGNWRIEPVYVYADRFSEDCAIVGDGRKFGYIDKTGRRIAPMLYDAALRFREGLAGVQMGERCGFINPRGQLAIPMRYARVRSFQSGMAVVQLPGINGRGGTLAYINKEGEPLFTDEAGKFDDLGDFSMGMARVSVNRKWGFINRAFEVVIEPRYDEVRDFVGGLAAVREQSRWGYIDEKGEMVITPQFEYAGDFDEVMALVRSEGHYGYINRVGRFSIPLDFKEAEPFFRNYARVQQEPSFGYVNIVGQVVWDPRAPLDRIADATRAARGVGTQRSLDPPAWREGIERPYPLEFRYIPELPGPARDH